ncbi:hypothetical protein C8A00DRAFT_36290 [Chaetomidium leptoderma]|uniref:Uncharacterized protein n=1 Tax=Chaetomidium leptoderma TaxID=669021 RepID=A0AAN6VHR2_9PEZI|nr:hypothetical protein C8A00DRAFT_36290 [Chaetomidium leptoderma]
MRPALLPPLVIPTRHSAKPILIAPSYYYQPQTERAISSYRPSYQSLPPKPPPKPRRQAPLEIKLEDFDDIDVFNFYNPCLLPPSPIRPMPARASTDPNLTESSTCTRDPLACPAPGLRRSTYTVTRRERSNCGRNNRITASFPPPRSRSPSPPPPYAKSLPPLPIESTPVSPIESRPPSPVPALRPRRFSLPQWDTSSSIYTFETLDVESLLSPKEGQGSQREEVEEEVEEYLTPFLQSRPVSLFGRSQDGYEEREQTALKELWGVIDGLLGPGTGLGDYDATSIASSMEGLGKALRGLEGGDSSRNSGVRVDSVYGVQQEAAWWRAFRQGLLLS